MFLIKENRRKGWGVRASEGGKEGRKKGGTGREEQEKTFPSLGALVNSEELVPQTLNSKYV